MVSIVYLHVLYQKIAINGSIQHPPVRSSNLWFFSSSSGSSACLAETTGVVGSLWVLQQISAAPPKQKELIRKQKTFGTNIYTSFSSWQNHLISRTGSPLPGVPPGPLSLRCDLLLDVDHGVILVLSRFRLHLGDMAEGTRGLDGKRIEVLVAIPWYFDI